METGYDSYWMYQNSRPEPLHNLQNNNQYSYAVFTDSNKQVQNRTPPSHYNNCMQPPNNVAYYHQSNQYRTSDYQQTWPSSVYSVPFKPSYVNNTQTRRASVNWSSSSGYLPPTSCTHENPSVRYSPNHFSQLSSSTNNSNSRFNPAPATCRMQQISRIRVKDVYSINNNPVSDPLLNKSLLQTQSKQQSGSVINYMLNNKAAIDLNPQTKFIDNSHLPQPTPPPPYYRHMASEQPQQFHSQLGSGRLGIIVSPNNTSGFVSQEIHPSRINHNSEVQKVPRESFDAPHGPDDMLPRAHANEKALENTNSGQLDSVQTFDRITHGIFNTTSNSQIQNCRLNELESTAHFETLSSPKTSAYGTYGMSNSSHVPAIPICHENVTENGGANLASFNSPKISRTNLNSLVSANPETTSHDDQSQEGTLIKISIPHTGKSSFIRLNDFNGKTSSSNLSLPCLLESSNVFINSVTRDLSDNINEHINSSVLQTTTSENTGNRTLTSVESRKVIESPEKSFINANKENVNNFISNSLPQNDLTSKTGVTNVSEMPVPEKDIKINIKQDDHSISGNKELSTINQKEKISIEETFGDNSAQFSEKLKNLEKSSSPALEETENSNSTEVRTFPKKCEDISLEKSESETKFLRNSVSNGQRLKKRLHQRRRYKSKINRVKLNMLIQFLERDDEPARANLETPCEKTTSENIKCRNNEKRRRRKLSKACVVKNRNISREMELLMSYKTSRVYPSNSSFESSHAVKSNVESQNEMEGKRDFAETGRNIKIENSSEYGPQKEDSSQSELNNELVTGDVQEPSFKCSPEKKDKEMINMMRILRTMTTNFCMNCKLSSSADSFWVNAVSFELRCLNCFKKFILEEFKTKNSEFFVLENGKQEVNSENENNVKDVNSFKYFSESVNSNSKEIPQEKSNNLKEENLTAKLPEGSPKRRRDSFVKSKRKKSLEKEGMYEETQNSEENVSFGETKNSFLSKPIREQSERKSSSTEESVYEDSSKKSILKKQHEDNRSRTSGNGCKSRKLLRSPSKEMRDKKDIPKKEKKENVDTPKRKSSTESAPNKTSVPVELAKKEKKRLMNSPTESTKKAKESYQGERPKAQPKISKHGQPEMKEMSQIPSKSKEISSTDESKSKSRSSDSEKKKSLKRKHDDRLPVNEDNKREKEKKLFTGKIPKSFNFEQRLRKTIGKR